MKLWQIALVSTTLGFALPTAAQMVGRAEKRSDVEARLKDQLGRMDNDHDGVVTRAEVLAYGQVRARERADTLFAEIDKDADGSVTKAEFEGYYASRTESGLGRLAAGVTDGDRIVIADAIKAALARFDAVDKNGDGTISPEERAARGN